MTFKITGMIGILWIALQYLQPAYTCNMKAGGYYGSESAVINPLKEAFVPRKEAKEKCQKSKMELAQFYDEGTKLAIANFVNGDNKLGESELYWLGLLERPDQFRYDDETTRFFGDWSAQALVVMKEAAEIAYRAPMCAGVMKDDPFKISLEYCNKKGHALCTLKNKQRPLTLQPETNEKCADSISITWNSDSFLSSSFNYNFRLINLDTHLDDPPLIYRVRAGEMGIPKTTKLKDGLEPYTNYRIELSMCTTVCCCGPVKSVIPEVYFLGGPTSPTDVEMQYNTDRKECQVMWMIPEKMPKEDYTGFKIVVKSNHASDLDADDDAYIDKMVANIEIETKYSFKVESNRRYTVTVQTAGCGRFSKAVEAEGECTTEPSGPDFIPSPGLMIMSNGQYSLRLTIPKEKNGPISCLFLIMRPTEKRMLSSTSTGYSVKQLKQASESSNELNKDFIAAALKRSDIQEQYIDIYLNQSTLSSCNIGNDGSPSNDYESKKFALNHDWYYSIVLVTSTPSFHEVSLKKSVSTLLPAKVQSLRSSARFIQSRSNEEKINSAVETKKCSSMGTILSVVFSILLVIALVGLFLIVKRKKVSSNVEDEETVKDGEDDEANQQKSEKSKPQQAEVEKEPKTRSRDNEKERRHHKHRKHRRHHHEEELP